jgi:hypothetical protein
MRRLFSFVLKLALSLAAALVALWAAGALVWRLAAPPWLAWLAAAIFTAILLFAVVDLWRRRWKGPVLALLAIAALKLWWGGFLPSHDRAWISELALLPRATLEGERLTVENLRNFRWLSDTEAEERWETRAFDLTRLEAADLALSYWSGEAVAHLIVSFVFRDGPPLALSIEVRREKGEEWSSLAGFFKQYELAFVAADERDLIGLRTHRRGEDVRLYQLRATKAQARDALLSYVADINRLAATPRWYDTLTTNCTTLAFRLVRGVSGSWKVDLPIDPRLLLTGYLPGYLRDVGALRADMPLDQLVAASRISERAKRLDTEDAAFSAKLREGLPARMQAPAQP